MSQDTDKSHPLQQSLERKLVIHNIFRNIFCKICPSDIVQLASEYCKCFKIWKPMWPESEDYIYLKGRIRASNNNVSSYYWRAGNAGGTIISLNSLPTVEDNVNDKYGEFVEWKVHFHRKPFCRQTVSLVTKPAKKTGWFYNGPRSYCIGIDGEGTYLSLLHYNQIAIPSLEDAYEEDEYETDEYEEEESDLLEEQMKEIIMENSHWYLPEKLTYGVGEDWRNVKAKIETYLFQFNICERTLTVFDPIMEKLGNKNINYTWLLSKADKWHLCVECESVSSRIEYEFV